MSKPNLNHTSSSTITVVTSENGEYINDEHGNVLVVTEG